MNALDLNDFLLSRQPILDLDEALVGEVGREVRGDEGNVEAADEEASGEQLEAAI